MFRLRYGVRGRMTETSKPNRARKPTAPVNRRTTSRTWGKSASGFDGSFKRTRYGYPSASARLAMQAESSLWGRKHVVGSRLKHDGTLGFISRGAPARYRRGGLHHRRRAKGRGRTGRQRRNDPRERNDDNSIGKISCEWSSKFGTGPFSCPSARCHQWRTRCQSPTASEPHLRQGDVK